jgi:hypothetical protein
MANPLAIYASNTVTGGSWSSTPIPTEVTTPFQFWPNLNEGGDNLTPSSGILEEPKYLFAATFTPTSTETFTFTRTWTVGGAAYTATLIPASSYDIVLTHAADNLYTATLFDAGVAEEQAISNQTNVPDVNQWRNAKTVLYDAVSLTEGATLALQTVVTNLGIPGSNTTNNPGMFTWTLEFYTN